MLYFLEENGMTFFHHLFFPSMPDTYIATCDYWDDPWDDELKLSRVHAPFNTLQPPVVSFCLRGYHSAGAALQLLPSILHRARFHTSSLALTYFLDFRVSEPN